MYAIDIPIIASFDGADINITETMIFSDRVVYHDPIDADIPLNPGEPLENFVNSFVAEWGFNPFSIIKQYITNGSNVSFNPENPGGHATAKKIFDILGVDYQYMPTTAGNALFTNIRINDGTSVIIAPASPYILNSAYWLGSTEATGSARNTLAGDPRNSDRRIYFSLMFYPERCYNSGKFLRHDLYEDGNCAQFFGQLFFEDPRNTSGEIILNRIQMTLNHTNMPSHLRPLIDALNASDNNGIIAYNPEDPYQNTGISGTGGGNGTGRINPSDTIDNPEAPDIDAVSTGLLTIFKPTLTQIQSLGDYLWSNAFDVDTLKKLFGDPMDAIIGLSIVPVNPPAGGSKNVKVGNIDTGISMSYLNRQFVEKDLGSLSIDPYVGSFMDYSPYTKIQVYLPYIGFRELAPEDVMGCTLSFKYIIDVLTGGCNAVINVSGKGAIYQYNGSCIANVPLTALNYSGAIQNAIGAIGNIATSAGGIATGNPALAGVGAIGLATRASNAVTNIKPTIQRSGNAGGASGLCGVQYPYAVIERPRICVPANYNNFVGNTLNVTMNIGSCSGYTIVEEIHLDNVICTENERDELLELLKEGVIIHVYDPEPEPEPEPNET